MAVAREVNQLKIGSLLSYVQMGLGAVVSLAFTPVMLRLLGRSEYGLYSTVTSAISMLSLLDLGFSSGYIRFYAQYREKGDQNGIARLNGFFLLLFSGLGLVALGCGLFLTSHAELVFSRGLTAEEYATARRLLRILSVNLSCMFPMRVFGNIISAKERFVFLRAVHLGRTVLSPLVMLPLLLMGYRSAAMVWVTLLFSLGTDLLFAWYVLRVLGEKFVFRGFERGAVRSLLLYTSFIAVNLIADQVNWNVDKVLLGRFRGTGEVAVYAVGYTLFQYYMMLSTSVSSVFTPRIHRIIRQTETDDRARRQALTELFTRVGRIQLLLLGLAATGVAFFGRAFILRWWAGPEYGGAYPVALILMLSATVDLIQNTGIEMQRAQNLHGFRSLVYGALRCGCAALLAVCGAALLGNDYPGFLRRGPGVAGPGRGAWGLFRGHSGLHGHLRSVYVALWHGRIRKGAFCRAGPAASGPETDTMKFCRGGAINRSGFFPFRAERIDFPVGVRYNKLRICSYREVSYYDGISQGDHATCVFDGPARQ